MHPADLADVAEALPRERVADLLSALSSDRSFQEWLKKEFSLLRTGRATSAILDSITVDSYGTQSPVAHVGNIVMEDARTLRVTPWDKTQVKAIEGAKMAPPAGLPVIRGFTLVARNFQYVVCDLIPVAASNSR